MRVVLFDIDGTLLTTGGAAREAFARALAEAAGHPIDLKGYSFSGKTDPQIARDIMTANGVAGERLDGCIDACVALYLKYFAEGTARQRRGHLLPGVRELLDALAQRPFVHTALLTGNVEPGARIKLGHFDLAEYFDFDLSCFGSDDSDRYRLPALAVERARRRIAPDFQGDQLVIVGDSEHDVLCGRSVRARSIAVGTGWTPAETLRALGPDAFLDDLADTERALGAILNGAAAAR